MTSFIVNIDKERVSILKLHLHLVGRVKIQLIKTVFENIHTLHFKRFKVFEYRDLTGETNMDFTSSPS